MEKKEDEVEDIEISSSDSFIGTDDDESSASEQDVNLHPEEPLTEQETEELVNEYIEVESKAAEAQEALEKESLARLEDEVRAELAQTYDGDDLEKAVADELDTYREEWEAQLDELETESIHLLELLDGAGVELPSLFKWIESQAPNSCCTEAWKKRAHWVGSQVTSEITETVVEAEKHLQTVRPIRRRHGRVLEEGASGFLQKKLVSDEIKDSVGSESTVDWGTFNKMFTDGSSDDATSFGSKNWASVYLASTPQQAAQLGIKFPGVDEVEEIADIDGSSSDPFVVDAIANERELVLSEEQKQNFRKVKEEEDADLDRKLQHHLKQKRHRRRCKKNSNSDMLEGRAIDNPDKGRQIANGLTSLLSETAFPNSNEEINISKKRSRTVIIDSDDEAQLVDDSLRCVAKNEQSVSKDSGDVADSSNGKLHCTACGKVAGEVHAHPLLKVIICNSCKHMVEEKMRVKDTDCSECYCEWCGRSSDLLSCRSCKTLFCASCIKRNFGEEYMSKVQAFGWNCFCCSPSVLHKMKLELDEAIKSGVSVVSSSGSGSDTSDADINIPIRSRRKRKKKIRRILDDAELGEETKRKIAIEKERQERLRSLQVQFSAKSNMSNSPSRSFSLSEGAAIDMLGDASGGYIVNVVREKSEEAVRIPPSISSKLKAHQVAGIRFIWENIVQSIRRVRSGDKGLGCILAHTMGLGKTFQVIAFLYTAMRVVELGLKTALIVTPVNVLHNWRREFVKWTPSEFKPLRVYMLEDVSRERRAELLAKWRAKGGVFLISYTAFRNLSFGKNVKDRNAARDIICALQDGPDILICDEAHIIKNTQADTTQALKQIKCQRRIALTGSPLQNNLMEYYCMVDFVREGFLGSSHEFRNRFQNPIVNGQHTNSTSEDVKIMNQRSHILYEQLKGFVQRMDMNVVKKDLPPKTVFVIAVKLSSLQRKLYRRFLDVHGFTTGKLYDEKMPKRSFFAGYQALAQIWNHPGILQLKKEDREHVRHEETTENFGDDSSSDENIEYNIANGGKANSGDDLLGGKVQNGFLCKDWWNDLLRENDFKELGYSGKMVLLLDILIMSSDVGDKALVFSQSIPTLDLIEFYLSKLPRQDKCGKFWKKGKDWYRLDGRTESSERQKLVERFNEPQNRRVKCTLISTRAGSLGINLHAANRVVIVDGSWNPTYDLQAIYRAWRYGQTKPVFAYRLMAQGTMEEKIYKRQVTKEGLAARVVDRQQVHRTISKEEMLHLFEFGDDDNPEVSAELCQEAGDASKLGTAYPVGDSLKQRSSSCGSCFSDKIINSLLGKHHPRWITNYHEHETLLQENEDEKLTKEEQDRAWEVYQKTLEWEEVQRVPVGDAFATDKPVAARVPSSTSETTGLSPNKGSIRSHIVQRKCTNLSHLLTLRSQGTKIGCSTVCGECAQEISREALDRDCKQAR
ncbi:protein CHROMATIN REMODELING 20 isoform X2 [Rhodamnia argentea]|uniref:ATP-dependent helicase ATRX n=1 Tax=Rhodamnia argentea TaxID=178133 RepID=A0A8B8MQG2_9MYRT|nr:protein CHROMATIN REMODELING 20 isoform X2 [Rhodamnia argentea]